MRSVYGSCVIRIYALRTALGMRGDGFCACGCHLATSGAEDDKGRADLNSSGGR